MDQLASFLLVEDDDEHAAITLRVLERSKIINVIDRVKDGEEALAYLNKEAPYADKKEPDLVLLDINLPKISGLEVLEYVKKHEKLKRIPIVMLTTSDAEIDRVKAYNNHVNSYLVKPIDFPNFQKLIDNLSFYWGILNRRAPIKA